MKIIHYFSHSCAGATYEIKIYILKWVAWISSHKHKANRSIAKCTNEEFRWRAIGNFVKNRESINFINWDSVIKRGDFASLIILQNQDFSQILKDIIEIYITMGTLLILRYSVWHRRTALHTARVSVQRYLNNNSADILLSSRKQSFCKTISNCFTCRWNGSEMRQGMEK